MAQIPSSKANEFDHDLVPVDEFDALCLEIKTDKDSLSSEKYPAKLHARKVAAELGFKHGLLYLPGEPTRNYEFSDQGPVFRQRRYFFYLSGVSIPDCHVTYEISRDRLVLWIPYVDPRTALYYGSVPSIKDILDKYDLDGVRHARSLPAFLQQKIRKEMTLYALDDEGPPITGVLGLLGHPREGPASEINYSALRGAMDNARVIKTEHEIRLIRRANDISSAAHRVVAAKLLSFRNEQDIEAAFLAECIKRGAHSQAYQVIAGSGVNASTLHYFANNESLKGRELVTMDAGCEFNCYASDITRTLPLNGTFSPEAAEIHQIVQRMQDETVKAVKPGVLYYKLHYMAASIALNGLHALGILKGDKDAIAQAGTVAAFFPHGLGHHVGLEVHDVSGTNGSLLLNRLFEGGRMSKRQHIDDRRLSLFWSRPTGVEAEKTWQALRPGMVVTVEPGIYFCRPFLEGFYLRNLKHKEFIDGEVLGRYWDVGGVRIEDDILVTDGGYENLTTAPKGQEMIDIINGKD